MRIQLVAISVGGEKEAINSEQCSEFDTTSTAMMLSVMDML